MHIFILRHADAESLKTTDAMRGLTDKGKAQAAKVGEYCKRVCISPDVILSSPYKRAMETASLVAGVLNDDVIQESFLTSGMDPQTAFLELKTYEGKMDSVMLVGHQPDLSLLIAFLLGISQPDAIAVSKACLIGIEISDWKPGNGTLELMIPVQLM